jgi:hypothetical protein
MVFGIVQGGPRALDSALVSDWTRATALWWRSGEQSEREEEEESISLRLWPTGDEDRGGGHMGQREAVGVVVYVRW